MSCKTIYIPMTASKGSNFLLGPESSNKFPEKMNRKNSLK